MRHYLYSLFFLLYTLHSTLYPLSATAQMYVPKGGERIIGNVRGANPAGMYSLPTVSGGERIPLVTGSNFTYNGSGLFNGEYYIATSWTQAFGTYFVYHYMFDPTTWEGRGHYEGSVGTIATDMDYCKADKRIYGCFYNDSGDGYVFGYINVSGSYWERVAVCELTDSWVGFAIHPDGTFYCITNRGRLCTVDPETGDMDEVGNTGLSPRYVGSATISAETKRLYFNLIDNSQMSYLYAIDTATAEATKLYQVGSAQPVYGMYVPAPLAENGAPAAVEDFTMTFANGELSGRTSFTVPTECYDGSPLTGALTYEIRLNNNATPYMSGSVTAGQKVDAEVMAASVGLYNFALTIRNAAGSSPAAKKTVWVGKDSPSAPTNVVFAYDNASQTTTLTWTAPTTSQHDGYVDYNALTYNIVRYPDVTVVGNAVKGTKFTENLPMPSTLTHYYYTVQAAFDGNRSPAATSNQLSLGCTPLPFDEGFDTVESLKGWKLVNLNDDIDYYSWSYYQDSQLGNCLVCMNSMKGENNDWAMTPGMYFEAGLQYDIALDVCGYKQYPNVFRLCMGTSQEPSDMTIEILPRTEHRGDSWERVYTSFTPTTSGVYHLGINDVSAYNMYTFFVDNVSVSAGVRKSAPAKPTAFSVVPDPYGGRRVDVSFDTPTVDALGAALTSLTKAEIYRDDALVKTFDSPAVGAHLSYTDTTVSDGYHTYRALAYNENGAGQEVTQRCFVGPNTPDVPTDVTVEETDDAGTVTISWTAPETDVDGQAIAPELITYIISMTRDGVEHEVATGVSGTSFTYRVCAPDDEQTFVYFNVKGRTAGGTGEAESTVLYPVGRAYTMTFSDSFAGGAQRYRYGSTANNNASWASVSAAAIEQTPQDGDDGMLRFMAAQGGLADYLLPKVRIEGNAPVLTFWARNHARTAGNRVQLIAALGAQMKILSTWDISSTTWTEYTVSLAEFAGTDVRFILRAAYQNSSYTYVDNLHIKETAADNLSAYEVSAPSAVRPDETFSVKYTIENNGTAAATGYTVHLLRDGESIATAAGKQLAAGKKVSGSFTTSLNSAAHGITRYGIRIDYAADGFIADNTTAEADMAQVALVTNALPMPLSLSGELATDGYHLSWEAPEKNTAATAVSEGFEMYAHAATSHIGDWTLVDADGNISGGVETFKIGIENQQISFFVFDMSLNSKFPAAHTGNKMMATIFTNSGANDDWLITPRLCGTQQYISFFARSYRDPYNETFEMLYTTGDDPKDISAFQVLKRVNRASAAWTEYGALVPDGATYFAIRCVSENQFFFLVDDITYIPDTGAEQQLTFLGYNVYRDYERLNAEPLADCRFTDEGRTAAESRIHTYTVTAVYAEGESAHSNECLLIPAAIHTASAAKLTTVIYDLQGRRVTARQKGIVIANGKKVVR